MEDVDVDVGWPMSIIIPACMHSIEPGLGILSARKGGREPACHFGGGMVLFHSLMFDRPTSRLHQFLPNPSSQVVDRVLTLLYA